MPLAVRVLFVLLLAGALLAPVLTWRRAAFVAVVALGLCSFALRAGWPAEPLSPTPCELLVGPALALHSFRNTAHIVLFALCFPLARAQFRPSGTGGRTRWRADAGALVITVGIGALLELAQGLSGAGHCRLRDLLPDTAGALFGWAALAALGAARTRWWRGRPTTGAEQPG